MYHKILSIITLVLMLMSVLGTVVIQISFHINKKYIVKELCVQKNEEKNTCQGQCHLKKQLKQIDQTEEDESKNNQRVETFSFVWFYNDSVCCSNLFLDRGLMHSYYYSNLYQFNYSDLGEHPPKVLV